MQSARSDRQLAEARHLKGASFHQLSVQGRAMPGFLPLRVGARLSVSRCASRCALAPPCSDPRLTLRRLLASASTQPCSGGAYERLASGPGLLSSAKLASIDRRATETAVKCNSLCFLLALDLCNNSGEKNSICGIIAPENSLQKPRCGACACAGCRAAASGA